MSGLSARTGAVGVLIMLALFGAAVGLVLHFVFGVPLWAGFGLGWLTSIAALAVLLYTVLPVAERRATVKAAAEAERIKWCAEASAEWERLRAQELADAKAEREAERVRRRRRLVDDTLRRGPAGAGGADGPRRRKEVHGSRG